MTVDSQSRTFAWAMFVALVEARLWFFFERW
jgi:hypothetical protein